MPWCTNCSGDKEGSAAAWELHALNASPRGGADPLITLHSWHLDAASREYWHDCITYVHS